MRSQPNRVAGALPTVGANVVESRVARSQPNQEDFVSYMVGVSVAKLRSVRSLRRQVDAVLSMVEKVSSAKWTAVSVLLKRLAVVVLTVEKHFVASKVVQSHPSCVGYVRCMAEEWFVRQKGVPAGLSHAVFVVRMAQPSPAVRTTVASLLCGEAFVVLTVGGNPVVSWTVVRHLGQVDFVVCMESSKGMLRRHLSVWMKVWMLSNLP